MGTNHIKSRVLALGLIAVGLLWAGGCARYHDYSAFLPTPRPLVTATTYQMEPPDKILLQSKRVREVDGHVEVVSPDGRLNLPLLGSVFVAGRTCEEVALELEERAREFYEDPDVTMRVVGYASKKIYVFGEVGSKGAQTYDGANTVLEALAIANPTRLADPSRIHVLRPSADGDLRKRMTIDLDRMIQEGDTTLNAVLEEGDIVFVPANPLAAVGLGLQQLLLPIQPASSVVQSPVSIDNSIQSAPYRTQTDTIE